MLELLLGADLADRLGLVDTVAINPANEHQPAAIVAQSSEDCACCIERAMDSVCPGSGMPDTL